MRAPESTGKLDTVETNPLPHVSSARAWDALAPKAPPRPSRPLVSLPKAAPVIRVKPRADRTEEICAEDIMVIVPPRAAAPSSEELDDSDLEIEVEHAAPEFRPPAFSVHATQEILVEDVIEVANAPLPPPPPVPYFAQPQAQERPSSIPPPWTVDAHSAVDEFEFPTPPQYSGPHPAISARITAFSATQVFRRRSANMKVVIASVSLAASVVLIAGIARLAPSASFGSEGPVGISVHSPKKLDSSVRGRTLAYGRATHVSQVADVAAISIDSLPLSHDWAHTRHHY